MDWLLCSVLHLRIARAMLDLVGDCWSPVHSPQSSVLSPQSSVHCPRLIQRLMAPILVLHFALPSKHLAYDLTRAGCRALNVTPPLLPLPPPLRPPPLRPPPLPLEDRDCGWACCGTALMAHLQRKGAELVTHHQRLLCCSCVGCFTVFNQR